MIQGTLTRDSSERLRQRSTWSKLNQIRCGDEHSARLQSS
jgi:hypothetical protein